ncbi:MAG TPA: protease complex subunit PrcB family protein, partial [Armatimonadota bacterium]
IDFATQMAVGVFIGSRPTGGYAVAITSVERIDDRVTVRYRVSAPQAGQVVTQGVTYPYAIAIIPASTLPVMFQAINTPLAPITVQ